MFFSKMSGVLASDLFAFVTTDRLTNIRQHLGRRFIVRGVTSVNKLLRFAKPYLRLFLLRWRGVWILRSEHARRAALVRFFAEQLQFVVEHV